MGSKSRNKENFIQIKEILKELVPHGKIEFLVFTFFSIFYLSYSILLATNTSIIDYKDLLYDVYFSFDNPIIYRQGYVYMEGHPLMMFITIPFIFLGNLLAGIWGYKIKTVFLTILCTSLISMSSVYIHRYLNKIISLKGVMPYLLIVFFGLSSTNLILSFTPESFTITTFLLSFVVYYYSYKIKQKEDIRLSSNLIFATLLGGITITNFAKGLIPILFSSPTRKILIRKIIITSAIFSLIIIWMQIQYDFISLIQNRLTGNISVPARGNYFEKLFDWLYAGPIFFPEIIILPIKIDGITFDAISLEFYHHWWQYAFSTILLLILGASIYKNYKNPLVQMIILLLLEDVIIHAIIRYGIRDAFIYGGHWLFSVPILLGWLYSLIKTEKQKKYATMSFSVLLIALITNNIFQLSEFIYLSLHHFPPY